MLAQFFGCRDPPRCIGMKHWVVSGVVYFQICVTAMIMMEWRFWRLWYSEHPIWTQETNFYDVLVSKTCN